MLLQSFSSYKYHPRGVVVAVSFLDQMVPGSIPLAVNFFFSICNSYLEGCGFKSSSRIFFKKILREISISLSYMGFTYHGWCITGRKPPGQFYLYKNIVSTSVVCIYVKTTTYLHTYFIFVKFTL